MALTKQNREKIHFYILDCIGQEAEHLKAPQDRLGYALNRFEAEFDYNIKQKGKYYAFAEWLGGLALSFDYMNYKILELGKAWGYNLVDERQENRFLEFWWQLLTREFFMLCRKYGVEE